MLKSLGQWTEPSLPSRKVVPVGLSVATMKESNPQNGEQSTPQPVTTMVNREGIVTPQGRIINLEQGDGDFNVNGFGDNEQLVLVQATEKSLLDEDLKTAVNTKSVNVLFYALYNTLLCFI